MNTLNNNNNNQGEKQTISDLDKQQQEFYTSLNQPANVRGWINRIKETTSYAYSFLGRAYNENKEILNYGLLGIGIIIVSFASYFYYKKK